MTFEECLNETIALLRRQQRVSYRALKRQFEIDDAYVEDLRCELVEVLGLALDHDGKLLVWKREQAAAAEHKLHVDPVAARAAQAPAPMAGAERRQLTVMFCDLVGSTELSAQLDPEDLRNILRRYQGETSAVIRRFDGFVAQYLGDGMLMYFGYPRAHEDDAQRAVRAGLGVLEAMQGFNRSHRQGRKDLAVRIGIHTGLVVVSEVGGVERREPLALGETPNIAAKLQALAAPDTLLVTAATKRLVEDAFVFEQAGPLELKGRSEPLMAFRVIGVRESERWPTVASTAGASPLVGRGAEVQFLTERWARSKEGFGQVMLLLGEAGIGKSRLAGLLREHVSPDGGICITFRCSPYFVHSALHPVIVCLQQLLDFQREDAADAKFAKLERSLQRYHFADKGTVPLIASLLSIPVPEVRYPALELSPQQLKRETAEALTAWLVEEAQQHPVLLVIEDLHWADPTLIELLTLLIDRIPAARMMLLMIFRPEFAAPRPWAAHSYVSQIPLGRLDRREVETLIPQLLRGKKLPDEVLKHIVAKTDGVPLFVEELLKMVLESGMVSGESGEYRLVGPLPQMGIPTTLQDLLMARLDRIAAAREIAQIGAALGREFSYELIQAVAPMDSRALDQGLERLVEAELIYRRSQAAGTRYVFKHALIRDAAYQSLLKSRRSFLHDRIARAMEQRFPEIRETQPELLAHHYTEAGLAEEAAGCWQRAAQRAIERSAYVEAIHHLDAALRLHKSLPATAQTIRRELMLRTSYGLALTATKGYAAPELEDTYARARELSRQIGEAPEILPLLNGSWSFYHVRGDFQSARELGEQQLRLAEKSESPVALIQARRSIGVTLLYSGELEPGLAHIEKAIALYDPTVHCDFAFRLNGLDLGVSVLSFAAWGSWLLGRPTRALQRNDDMISMARSIDHPYTVAWALVFSGWLYQMRRDVELTRARAEATIALAKEHGFSLFQAMGTILRGWSLAMSGSTQEGIAELCKGTDQYRQTGARSSLMHWHVLLAEAYHMAGQFEKGLSVLIEAQGEQSGERYYEAELHRMRGELIFARARRDARALAESERCFAQALEVARAQRARSLELRAAMSLSRLWRQQGRTADAQSLLAVVVSRFDEGFDTADLQEAAALVNEDAR